MAVSVNGKKRPTFTQMMKKTHLGNWRQGKMTKRDLIFLMCKFRRECRKLPPFEVPAKYLLANEQREKQERLSKVKLTKGAK